MRADLHIHTYYSDGKYPPEELARRAKAAGLSLISLTDHDSLAGLHEKRAAAEGEGLSFVSGWEVSAYEGEAKVHVLGYGCLPDAAYEDFLEARRRGALARAEEMIQKGNAYFSLHLTLADAERFHLKKEAPLHTMHVVSAFSQKLGVKRGALYLSAFSAGKPCCSDIGRPTPFDALRVIHAAGGIASLAHPGRIPLPEPEKFASNLIQIVSSGPDTDWEAIMQGIAAAIMSATKYVYIHTPYFIPNELILGVVQMAALSGVDVRLMIPSRSDSRFTDASTSSYMGQVLESGAKVLRYSGGFLHSKAIVIDDFSSIIGSCNMDERSFSQNFEVNAFIYEKATAGRLRDLFLRDMEKCEELTLDVWLNRKRKDKLTESVARLFSPLQ